MVDHKENKLSLLGFNLYESKIINILLSGGLFSVKEIYQKIKIPKNKIYESLDVLKSKGIIGEQTERPKKYFILSDSILDDMIKEKEEQLLRLKQEFEDMKKKKEKINPSVLSIIEGEDEVHKVIEYSNHNIKKEILSCSRLTKMYYSCYRSLKLALDRGIKAKFVVLYNKNNFDVIKAYYDIGVEIRIYNKKDIFPKIGLLDGKYTRITIWKPDVKNPKQFKTIWANSSLLYRIVRNHFNKIWEESIPFDPKKFKR